MNRLFAILLLLAISFASSSCYGSYLTTSQAQSAGAYTSGTSIGSQKMYISGEIFQTLSRNECLVRTKDYKVVKLESLTEVFFDDKPINGYFIFVGTYSYYNKEDIKKVVPIYVSQKELKNNPAAFPIRGDKR